MCFKTCAPQVRKTCSKYVLIQDDLSYRHTDEGRIEDSCYLASKRFRDPTGSCSDRILNPMAVAVINSLMDKVREI